LFKLKIFFIKGFLLLLYPINLPLRPFLPKKEYFLKQLQKIKSFPQIVTSHFYKLKS